jgi:hypothetical protein
VSAEKSVTFCTGSHASSTSASSEYIGIPVAFVVTRSSTKCAQLTSVAGHYYLLNVSRRACCTITTAGKYNTITYEASCASDLLNR